MTNQSKIREKIFDAIVFNMGYPRGENDHVMMDKTVGAIELLIKETIEKCQKEMKLSLEEVAQYEGGLVNKEDIKVWIHNLPNHVQ